MIRSLLGNAAGNAGTGGNISAEVYNKVSKLMASQNTAAPKLNAALSADRTKLSGIGQLRSALASFQGVAEAVGGGGARFAATSSAASVVAATASAGAAAGTHAIEVKQLAQSQVLRSKPVASATAAIGSGLATRLDIDFGSVAGKDFTPAAGAASRKTLLVPAGAHSLQGIADAINRAGIGIAAKVTADGSQQALELTSPSGANASLRIAVSGDPALKQLLGYDPAGAKGLTETAAARDALLTVDGVALKRAANTVVDAVPGTTLNLRATGSTTVTIAQGATPLVDNMKSLVDAYNALNARLNALAQGDLKDDGSAARVRSQLAQIIGSGAGAAALGIGVQKNGTLTLDTAKLGSAVAADAAGTARLVGGDGKGIADRLNAKLREFRGADGTLARRADSLNRDIDTLNAQRDKLEQTLTARATALVEMYSGQASYGRGGTFGAATGRMSLFDYL